MQYQYDLFVIGAGSGGVRAARTAASLGARVAIAEERHVGGTCVNVGCVPKKLLVYASQYAESFRGAAGFGWQLTSPVFDWATLVHHKNVEINRLQGVYQRLLADSGVISMEGRATIVDAHTVALNGQHFSARHILIATGGKPFVPEIPGREWIKTSNEMFYLEQLPASILIVGGGYIAVEFAGILHGLGVQVTLVERNESVLNGFDEDVRDFISQEMQNKGIQMHFNTSITHIDRTEHGYQASTSQGIKLEAGLVMYATGRIPNTTGLGLEAVGVAQDKLGAIQVNADYQTSVASIYALGDVTNRVNLTPVATAEGTVLAHKLFGQTPQLAVDYENIPTAVFCQPNIASVGLTEAQARARHGEDIAVFMTRFRPMKHTLSGSSEKVLMKMLVVKSTDRVVGMHMVGADAGEIIQGMAVAIRAGATKAVFDATIGIHPTAAEEFVTLRNPLR